MADKNQSPTPKSDMKEKARRPVVGRDVPDESKEHHTEIAVEAGRHDELHERGGRQGNKR